MGQGHAQTLTKMLAHVQVCDKYVKNITRNINRTERQNLSSQSKVYGPLGAHGILALEVKRLEVV